MSVTVIISFHAGLDGVVHGPERLLHRLLLHHNYTQNTSSPLLKWTDSISSGYVWFISSNSP
jgi:hypothetical protein